jgi:hypothetical protein
MTQMQNMTLGNETVGVVNKIRVAVGRRTEGRGVALIGLVALGLTAVILMG